MLRNKRSLSELWNQKGECVILCNKQLCIFPTPSEQESGIQTKSMKESRIWKRKSPTLTKNVKTEITNP